MNNKKPVLFVRTTTKRISDPLAIYLRSLGINPKKVDTKVISQNALTETPVFVETVKANTGTTVVITNQITKAIMKSAVQTGNDIIVLYNNGNGWNYTRYANGMKTTGIKTENRKTAGVTA